MGTLLLWILVIGYLSYLFSGWSEERKYEAALYRAQSWRPPTCTCIPNALTDNPNCPDHGDK